MTEGVATRNDGDRVCHQEGGFAVRYKSTIWGRRAVVKDMEPALRAG